MVSLVNYLAFLASALLHAGRLGLIDFVKAHPWWTLSLLWPVSFAIHRLVIFVPRWRIARHLPSPGLTSWTSALLSPFIGHVVELVEGSDAGLLYLEEKATTMRAAGHQLMTLRLFDRIVTIPLSGSAMHNLMLSTKELTKGTDYDFVVDWLGRGLLLCDGTYHKERRRLLNDFFTPDGLVTYEHTMNAKSRDFVLLLMSKGTSVFDVYSELKHATLSILLAAIFGYHLDRENKEDIDYVASVHGYAALAQRFSIEPWMWIRPIWYALYHRHHQKLLKNLKDFSHKIVDARLAEGDAFEADEHPTLLDRLLRLHKAGKLSTEAVRDEVDTFMFAGHDTTSCSLGWALWVLATVPGTQDQLLEEILCICGDDCEHDVTLEQTKEMKLLDQFINEVYRLFPTVPFFERQFLDDFPISINGKPTYTLPQGSETWISPILVHRNPDIFPDPLRFDITRNAEREKGSYNFIPFSAGARNCLGQRFAVMEEKIILAHIIRNFVVASEGELHSLRLKPEIVLNPVGGFPLSFTPRPP